MRLGRAATRGNGGRRRIRDGGIRSEGKNPLTADLVFQKKGEKIQLCISSNRAQKTKLCSWECERAERIGGWGEQKNRKLMGK